MKCESLMIILSRDYRRRQMLRYEGVEIIYKTALQLPGWIEPNKWIICQCFVPGPEPQHNSVQVGIEATSTQKDHFKFLLISEQYQDNRE